jgi:hypothetical protein
MEEESENSSQEDINNNVDSDLLSIKALNI